MTFRDATGNHHLYAFNFNSEGLFVEAGSSHTHLPLFTVNGNPIVTYEEFYRVMAKEAPMI